MVYKLFIEDGDYIDVTTGERRNMMSAGIAYTPEGVNVGWTEYESDEAAMAAFNIRLMTQEERDALNNG